MMAWLDAYGVSRMQEMHLVDEKGPQHIYRWLNDVPLTGQKDTLRVNYLDHHIVTVIKMEMSVLSITIVG
jgi:hypothetical protein